MSATAPRKLASDINRYKEKEMNVTGCTTVVGIKTDRKLVKYGRRKSMEGEGQKKNKEAIKRGKEELEVSDKQE